MAATSTPATATTRAPPGGSSTVMLGDDGAAWTTTSDAHSTFEAHVTQAALQGSREPPGGLDSVQLGGSVDSVTATELLVRPSPGGTDSIAFGKDAGDSLPATQLLARASPGGVDSVNFGSVADTTTSEALLKKSWPGGSTSIVLGSNSQEWTTNSQAHGVGGAEAAAAAETIIRPAPGGIDSINFCPEHNNLSSEVLLTRPSPGGADSVHFSSVADTTLASEVLLARAWPGGSTTVVLGGDRSEWTTNSQVHGVGSLEAVAAAEAPIRAAPGGVDSVDFSAEQCSLPSDVLLARPSPGGETEIVLGGDKIDWTTNSSSVGVGSVEAVAQAEVRSRPPPGGVDSVDSINCAGATASVQELLARPPTGGKAGVVLGGDSADWVTSSDAHGIVAIPSSDVQERQAPGGVDSVVLGGADVCSLTVGELLARPAPGGADSVSFEQVAGSSLLTSELLARPFPGGAANVVLGSDGGAWATSSQAHNGTAGLFMPAIETVRPPPGGVDSVSIATIQECAPSVEALLARPNPGGTATVVLGGDASNWATCGSALGAGCADAAAAAARPMNAHNAPSALDSIDFAKPSEQISAKPLRTMCPDTLTLGDEGFCPEPGVSTNRFACGSNQNQGNWITDRSTTRLHQAPGGNSSISLADGSSDANAGASTSANRFACGSNQNQGNWMTDRSTTRLHQAPGGNSSINLSDGSTCPAVGVASNRFAKGAKKVYPQDENVNIANVQQIPHYEAKLGIDVIRQAPGGDASIILG